MLFIRKRRVDMSLSQAQLAKMADIPQSVVAEIQTGKSKNPTVDTAIRIAKVLGCSVEDLTVSENEV